MADSFFIYPAIDLRAGKVVRLVQGDRDQTTVYGDDPAAAATRWKTEGATWLHVVNLDGAFGEDTAANEQAMRGILALGLQIQFGGGLRHPESIARAMESGVARVVIGTAAIENPALLDWALGAYGAERVAVGIDARDGLAQVRGWTQAAAVSAQELGERVFRQGARWCVFTDVSRDGLRTGVNVPSTAALARSTGLRVIASGGVAGIQDVRLAREAGLPGVIIGRALYDGSISLKEAIAMQA
jgi:phosphoribosylformimino-5-aminoimidazole carboxamide ribotide isomerase